MVASLGYGLEGLAGAVQRLEHAGAGQMVDHLGAGAALDHDADALQPVEVARKGGQAGGGEGTEIVDALVAPAEGLHDQDARGVGEGFQYFGAGFGLFGIH